MEGLRPEGADKVPFAKKRAMLLAAALGKRPLLVASDVNMRGAQ
jgi:hypothetical protein